MAQGDRISSTGGADGREPAEVEIRAELARILSSRGFAQAGRASEFLRFVVEETLAGRGSRLKGYTVAIEVFARPKDFDAQSDPLVRVEAGRLRRRLTEYYADEGQKDPVRIELPRGGYSVRFSRVEAPPIGDTEVRPVSRVHLSAYPLLAAAVVLATVAIGVAVWLAQPNGPQPVDSAPASQAAFGPRVLVLPFVNLNGAGALDRFAYGVTEEIVLRLTERNIAVIARYTGLSDELSGSAPALRAELGVGYLLTGSVRDGSATTRIAVRLVDTETGAQLWTHAYDETIDGDDRSAVQQAVANRTASILADPFGPMFTREVARSLAKPDDELTLYDCVLRFFDYGRNLDEARHLSSRNCLLAELPSSNGTATGWACLAFLYLHEYVYGYNAVPGGAPPLDRAREAARTALDIDGQDLLSILAMAGIRLASGERAEFLQTADRFLSLEPPLSGRAQAGMLLALSGEWDRGMHLIDEALEHLPNPPGWFYVPEALYYLRTGDYEAALDWALKIDAPGWFIAPMTVAVTAAYAGREELARRSVDRLLDLSPQFARDGRERLSRWRVDDALQDVLIEGLRVAGLEVR